MSVGSLEQAPCGFLTFSEDGTLLQTNAVLRCALGWPADDFAVHKFESLLSIASRLFLQTHLLPLLRLQGRADEISLTLLTKTRQPVPFLVNIVRGAREELVVFDCALMVFRERHRFEATILEARHAAEKALADNAELVTAKTELQGYTQELDLQLSRAVQRKNEISRVSQVLAHDLSEPARKLRLFADYLTDEAGEGLSATAKRHLERLHSESARIQFLIKNLQAFLTPQPLLITTKEVALGEVLMQAASRVSEEKQYPGFVVNAEFLPTVEGYLEDLQSLFYLLVHSLCESSEGSQQSLTVESCILKQNIFKTLPGKYRYDTAVRIIFSVTSLPYDLHLMQHFLTEGTKLPREWEQVSFNLALCQKLIDHHRGSVVLDSSVELGQRFIVCLPLKQS